MRWNESFLTTSSPSTSSVISSKNHSLKWPLFPFIVTSLVQLTTIILPDLCNCFPSSYPAFSLAPLLHFSHSSRMTFYEVNQVVLTHISHMAPQCICSRIKTCYHCLWGPTSSILACFFVLISHHPVSDSLQLQPDPPVLETDWVLSHKKAFLLSILFPPIFAWLLLILQISALFGLPQLSHSPPHNPSPTIINVQKIMVTIIDYLEYSESEMSVNKLSVKLLNYLHSQFPHCVESEEIFFTRLPDPFSHWDKPFQDTLGEWPMERPLEQS